MHLDAKQMIFDYQEFYDNAPVGYFTSNSSGIIVKANKYFFELIQRDADEVIDKCGLQDFLSIGSKIYFQTHYFPLLKIDGEAREINLELVKKDNTRTSILINTNTIDKNEDSTLFHSVAFEISERRLFEKELILAKKKAEGLTEQLKEVNEEMLIQSEVITKQNNSLERLNTIKDKFFSIIAHDIRGPLSELNGFVFLITDYIDTISREDLIRMSDQIKQSIANTVDLAENLINWAQSQMKEYGVMPTTFAVEKSIKSILNTTLQIAQKKGINLSYTLDGSPLVKADNNQLDFIIRNLVMNAIKFTSPGGFIKIHCHKEENNKIKLSITDNGVGMSKEFMDTLFLADIKTSKEGTSGEKGNGLGLLLVKEFVTMNNGEIVVSSKQGEGTTFTIILESGSKH